MALLKIEAEFSIGQTVYLATGDGTQAHQVIEIVVPLRGHVSYVISLGGDHFRVHEMELVHEKRLM